MRRPSRIGFAVAMAVVVAGGVVAWARQPTVQPSVDSSMSDLVAEIRALRQTVERSVVVAAQSQLLLGRVQLQEIRLATLGRLAQEARVRLGDAESKQTQLGLQLRQLTAAAESARDPEERQALTEDRIPSVKLQIKQEQVRIDRLRAEQANADAALANEQSRWSDFNARLEALERALDAVTTRGR